MRAGYMVRKLAIFGILFLLGGAVPSKTYAHAFGAVYTLPIPFWMYSYAAIGALLVSFLIIGFFITEKKRIHASPTYTLAATSITRSLTVKNTVRFFKSLSLFLFFLTIVTGLIGEDIPAYNFNMTFFWVIFVIGFTYLSFLLGNIWYSVNPWKILVDIFENLSGKEIKGTVKYPVWLGYYPAVVFYGVFIILELFLGTTPFSLSVLLLQYTFITLFAVFLFGKRTWFQYGEFFSVFFRLISDMSPVIKERDTIRLRLPFSGLINKEVKEFSLLLFILSTLAATAFDGFRETDIWADIHWQYLQGVLDPVFGVASYQLIDIAGLVIAPLVFLLLYVGTIVIMKKIVKTQFGTLHLAFLFAYSLLPITLVYNIAHYFTLLLLQGQEIIRLLSDPFGWGWNLFGTATFSANAGVISASAVWHMQVFVILLGHVISVLIAHFIALRIFPDHKIAVRSQVPMLLLMVAYTIIGLWILSQPLAVGV